MKTNYDKVNELRARMVTGPDLWKPAERVTVELDVDTVRFIGSEVLIPDEWSHETYEAIYEACRAWCLANHEGES